MSTLVQRPARQKFHSEKDVVPFALFIFLARSTAEKYNNQVAFKVRSPLIGSRSSIQAIDDATVGKKRRFVIIVLKYIVGLVINAQRDTILRFYEESIIIRDFEGQWIITDPVMIERVMKLPSCSRENGIALWTLYRGVANAAAVSVIIAYYISSSNPGVSIFELWKIIARFLYQHLDRRPASTINSLFLSLSREKTLLRIL